VSAATDTTTYVPERGDVAWVTLNPQAGHEQAGRRPVLVLSPSAYNGRAGLCVACPITSRVKGYPFEVAIPAGLPVSGVVLSDQVRSMDWRARRAVFLCRLSDELLDEVTANVEALIGPEED
jgi:mRNA interferase MazF